MNFKSDYSDVNGLKMYYEIYGQGKPLVLIHGGGSTIQSSFGRIIPQLVGSYTVIAVELQNHGRSGFRSVPETFEQDADDVAALLNNIGISTASFFGFSNGGTTAMQINIRHPKIVNKLVLAAAAYKRDGFLPGFFDGMQQATLVSMPQELKEAFLKVNPDTAKLQIMFERDRDRMIAFEDWSDEQVKSITAPTLLINGDADVVTPEHTLEMFRLIPNCHLAIIPGEHGKYIGEITTLSNGNGDIDFVVSVIQEFLDRD
jgi:pimeloyl-ACP methyl ester carboxylesterase